MKKILLSCIIGIVLFSSCTIITGEKTPTGTTKISVKNINIDKYEKFSRFFFCLKNNDAQKFSGIINITCINLKENAPDDYTFGLNITLQPGEADTIFFNLPYRLLKPVTTTEQLYFTYEVLVNDMLTQTGKNKLIKF